MHPGIHEIRHERAAEDSGEPSSEHEGGAGGRNDEQQLGFEAGDLPHPRQSAEPGPERLDIAEQRPQPPREAAAGAPSGIVDAMAVFVALGLAFGHRENEKAIRRPAGEEIHERTPGAPARRAHVDVSDDDEPRQGGAARHASRCRHASTISSKIVASGMVTDHSG